MNRPIEDFILRVHPEAMIRSQMLINGEEVEFGKPNRPIVRQLLREHFTKGQDALADFKKWLVRHETLKDSDATAVTAVVWNTLCLTYDAKTEQSDVCRLLDRFDETYAHSSKLRICSALRYWARFRKDAQLYEKLLFWLRRGRPDVAPQYVLEELKSSPPYTKAEYKKLLKSLEDHKGMPRMPWAYPCLRFIFACGITSGEVLHISKERAREALAKGFLTIQSKGKHTRLLPLKLVEEPLQILLAFPWEWGIVRDIVQPSGAKSSASVLIQRAAKPVYARARIEMTSTWIDRLRWTTGWLYYQKTKNLVGASQLLGIKDLGKVKEFIAELQRRVDKKENVLESGNGCVDESCVSE